MDQMFLLGYLVAGKDSNRKGKLRAGLLASISGSSVGAVLAGRLAKAEAKCDTIDIEKKPSRSRAKRKPRAKKKAISKIEGASVGVTTDN